MYKDKIVEEIRKVREDHAAKFNYDLDAIYKDLKIQEKQSNYKIVSLCPIQLKNEEKEIVSTVTTHV